MTADELRQALLAFPAVTEETPFGPGVLVYKVCGKMFALTPVEPPLSVSLKCDPILAQLLRDTYPAVTPGYHLNKRHWNTVLLDGADPVPDDELRAWIVDSYDLVVKGLPKRLRAQLGRA